MRFAEVPHWLVPTPSSILSEAIQSYQTFLPHAFATVQLALLGLAIGIACGLTVAVVLHRFTFIRELFYPFLLCRKMFQFLSWHHCLLFGLASAYYRSLSLSVLCAFSRLSLRQWMDSGKQHLS